MAHAAIARPRAVCRDGEATGAEIRDAADDLLRRYGWPALSPAAGGRVAGAYALWMEEIANYESPDDPQEEMHLAAALAGGFRALYSVESALEAAFVADGACGMDGIDQTDFGAGECVKAMLCGVPLYEAEARLALCPQDLWRGQRRDDLLYVWRAAQRGSGAYTKPARRG